VKTITHSDYLRAVERGFLDQHLQKFDVPILEDHETLVCVDGAWHISYGDNNAYEVSAAFAIHAAALMAAMESDQQLEDIPARFVTEDADGALWLDLEKEYGGAFEWTDDDEECHGIDHSDLFRYSSAVYVDGKPYYFEYLVGPLSGRYDDGPVRLRPAHRVSRTVTEWKPIGDDQ